MPQPDFTVSRRTFVTGSAAVAALFVAGCTKATSTGGNGTNSIVVGIPSDVLPQSFTKQMAVNFGVRSLVFDTLVALDKTSRQLVPRVASSWSWNSDKTVLTMQLRDDVSFHNGRKFGPQDAIYAVKVAQDPAAGSQVSGLANYITKMEASGPHTVTFTLKAPLVDFLDLFIVTPLVDSQTMSGIASGKQVVGTGPFKWVSWQPGSQVQLTRNDKYWRNGEPYADHVTLRVFTQSQALSAALRSGQINMAFQMVPRDAASFAADSSYEIISTKPTFTDWFLGINTSVTPFTDIRVRQAVAWAIDRDRIVNQVFKGFGSVSSLPALSTFPGLTSADERHYTYDPAKAKQLLAAAGQNGASISITANGGNPTTTSIVNIAQYDLEAVGFKVTPKLVDSATYQSQVQQAAVPGIWLGPIDLASISLAVLTLGNPPFKIKNNTSHVTDPHYAKLAGAVAAAASPAQQATANRAYMDYVLEQAFNITIAHGYYIAVIKKPLGAVTTTGVSELDLSAAK